MNEDGDHDAPEVANSTTESSGSTVQSGSIGGDVTVNHNRWTAVAFLSALVAFLAAVVAVVWLVQARERPAVAGAPSAQPTSSASAAASSSVSSSSAAPPPTAASPTAALVPPPAVTTPSTCEGGVRATVEALPEVSGPFDYTAVMACPPATGQEYRVVVEYPVDRNDLDRTEWYAQPDRLPPDLTTFTMQSKPSTPGSTRLIYVISCDPAAYDRWAARAPFGKPITGTAGQAPWCRSPSR